MNSQGLFESIHLADNDESSLAQFTPEALEKILLKLRPQDLDTTHQLEQERVYALLHGLASPYYSVSERARELAGTLTLRKRREVGNSIPDFSPYNRGAIAHAFRQFDVGLRPGDFVFGDDFAFDSGEVIFKQGDEADYAYTVSSGAVQVSRNGSVLYTYKPGQLFGDFAFILGCPRTAGANAVDRTELRGIDRVTFLDRFQLLSLEQQENYKRFAREMVEESTTA